MTLLAIFVALLFLYSLASRLERAARHLYARKIASLGPDAPEHDRID